jgi:signal transduction histidine kinase
MGLSNFLFGKISRKFMFIFVIIVLAVVLVGGLVGYFQNQILQEQYLGAISETEEDFYDIREESIRTLSAALEVILQDEKLKQVYLEKDRNKLFDYGQPLFWDLRDKYGITHFYFILPDGINFVRLHNKDIYGDKITRNTFEKARYSGNVGEGIELGKTDYALRVVRPYYGGGELIGYVELGQEIDEFLEIMKKGKNNEFALFVEKEYLSEEDWASTRDVMGLRNNWEDLGEHIIMSSTTEEVFSCFSDGNVNALRKQTSFLEKMTLDDETFACGGFALLDVLGEKSGVIFSFIDVSELEGAMANIRMVILSILFFIVLVFFGLQFYVSRKITRPIEKLDYAAEQIQKKNFKVRVDIRTGDELQELGDTFNETAKVLEKMDEEHKQLEKAKTEFLSITSHELRSPMTPMQAQLQMLIGNYYGKLTPKQKQAMEIVSRNTKRLDNIIVDFLEISRIEAARLKFRFVREDFAKGCIPRLIKEMGGFMPEKKIRVINKIGKLPVVEHDPDRLCQVLRNLISNAVKFSKPGTTVTLSAKLEGSMILFSVKDQGIGIKKSEQNRLFEPFFQAEQTMYREHQGTGLGLAIVRGIVESQNGRVWIESEVGKGTTFNFTLPLKPVRHIRPIKLLFSEQENIEKKLREAFSEMLGPMGEREFDRLREQKGLGEGKIVNYINGLVKGGVLTIEVGEEFKNKISFVYGRTQGIKSGDLFKKGLIRKYEPTKTVGLEEIQKSLDKKEMRNA